MKTMKKREYKPWVFVHCCDCCHSASHALCNEYREGQHYRHSSPWLHSVNGTYFRLVLLAKPGISGNVNARLQLLEVLDIFEKRRFEMLAS